MEIIKIKRHSKEELIEKLRIEDNKRLYRNFDSVFTNCSAPRE